MLMKTGYFDKLYSRTSMDNPEWMTVNFDQYRRSNFSSPPKYNHRE